MAPRALLLDFDGVCVDTETPSLGIIQLALAEGGFALSVGDVRRVFAGKELEHVGWPLSDMTDRDGFIATVRQRIRDEVVPAITVPAALIGFLSTLPVPYRIVTNAPVERVLHVSKLVGYGDLIRRELVVSATDVGVPKPSPAVYLAAVESVSVPAHECLAVEDSEVGATSARAAGVEVAVVAGTRPDWAHPGEQVVSSFAELGNAFREPAA